MSTLQVVGRKVVGLENPLRLDVVGFQDVTQERRDVDDDDPFIVLTETKFSFRCIPVWIGTLLTGLGSKKKHM